MTLWADMVTGGRISWEAVRANKLRSGLTTLGIIIGIVTVTLMGAAISGLNEAFLRSISIMGTDVLYVQKFAWFSNQEWWRVRNRRDLEMSDARALLKQATLLTAVSTEAQLFKPVQYAGRSVAGVMIAGQTEQSGLINGFNVSAGRYLSAADVDGFHAVCLLGASVAEIFFPHESPLGRRIKIDDINYEVIGVLGKMGQFFTGFNFDNQVVIPITRLRTDFAWKPDLTILAKVTDLTRMDDAREEVRGIIRQVRRLAPGDPDDFAINEQKAFLQTFNRVAGSIALVGLFVTSLALFVGGIGIMNIMFVSVAERTREIGIRKALGARRRSILIQFLLESATICLLGGSVGIGLAWILTLAVSRFLPATMSPAIVGAGLAVSLATGVISGFFPAWRAARMNPVEALRSE